MAGSDAGRIQTIMRQHACDLIITTEKDWPKIPDELRPIALVVRMDLELERQEQFWKLVSDRLRGLRCPPKNQIS